MAGTVFTSTVARTLKPTLELIIMDKSYENALIMPKWCEQRKMSDNYEDDLEFAGPGLVAEKAEGAEMAMGTLMEGVLTRYICRTYAMKLNITEEAIEDTKYERVLRAARHLVRSLYKTVEYDSSNMLVRAWNTGYPGGDGQPLCSASHTLPHGGTFSNTMAVPMTPSRQAVITARVATAKMVGHDGLREGYRLKKIVCPEDLADKWEVITGSPKAPEAGEFNAINVVNRMNLQIVANPYWTTTTTNYIFITDAEGGLNWRWRRKARNRSWVANDEEVMCYGVSARWGRGWSNPRGVYGVQS